MGGREPVWVCTAPGASPASSSPSENPVGSFTPLVLAQSSQRSTFRISSPKISVRCTLATFCLQMPHNIFRLLLYRLPRGFRQGVVALDEFPRNGAGFAVSNDPSVYLYDRHQLGTRASQKTFIRIEQIVARQVRFTDAQARVGGNIHDHPAGDAVERASGERRG